MPDRTQDLTNHRKVATACKNYTDTQIAQAKEEIYWHIGEYSVTTSDDNTSASVKTVPSNATRCKIKRVYGNTQKLNPTTASDSTSAMVKTMPSTVYDFDVSKVEGASYKYNQLVQNGNFTDTSGWVGYGGTISANNNVLTYTITATTSVNTAFASMTGIVGHKYLLLRYIKSSVALTNAYEYWGSAQDYYNVSSSFELKGHIFTYASGQNLAVFRIDSNYISIGTTIEIKQCSFIDLTQIFGAGNEPSDVASAIPLLQTRGYKLDGTDEYNTGKIRNFAWTGVKVYDSDNVEQVSKTIDLSTILYNGNPLFEENALNGVGTAKDYITPYVAHKGIGRVDLGTLSFGGNEGKFYTSNILPNVSLSTVYNRCLIANYNSVNKASLNDLNNLECSIDVNGRFQVRDDSYSTAVAFKTAMSGVYLYYELATPIEVSINWASTLRGITGYSNGTITLLNTYNMDSANTITYNSILKENCCAKMVQSRGGSVIKTINFPTQASDGYSAGSVANVRDFTNNTRTPYVDKVDLGSLEWTYVSASTTPVFTTPRPTNSKSNTNTLLCVKYEPASNEFWNIQSNDLKMYIGTNNINISNLSYTDANTFKTAMSGTYLYYEKATSTSTAITAIENVIEVEAGDTLTFYDSNDNLVTVPTDLTYRIEVAN